MKNGDISERTWLHINNYISNQGLYLILVSTAFVFINSLRNSFVFDDWILIVYNEFYRTFDIKRIFLSKANSLEYLPFRDLTLAIDYQLWGTNPFGYHLSNLLFYLCSLIVLYKMVRILVTITGGEHGELIPFWATLIFALHPMHVEVVNFIAARNNILAGLFLFLSFNSCITGIREKKNILIVLSALFFMIALFSKASVVFYPLFLALILFFIPRIIGSLRKKALILLLFCVLDSIGIWIHFKIASEEATLNEHIIRFGAHNIKILLMKAFQIPFFYIKKLIIPYPLSIDYSVSFGSGSFVLFFIYLLILLLIIWSWRKRHLISVLGITWFFLSLGPVLNIFPTSPVVADRYAYLAVLGFGLVLAFALKFIADNKKGFLFIILGLIIVWVSIDFRRNMDWRTDITLWESAASVNPDINRINLASALWNMGEYEKALAYFKEERDETGSYFYSLYQGKYLFQSGKYNDAVKSYQRALSEGAGALKETHLYLAQAYEKTESDMYAMRHYLRVFDIKSIDPLGEYEMMAKQGLSRIRKRLAPKLAEVRSKAFNEPMNFQVQLNTALFLYDLGMYSEAEEFYLKSLELTPSRWDTWYNLGLTYMKLRKYDKAIESFKQSVDVKPKNIDALRNIGICYMTIKDFTHAAKYFKLILEVDPNFLHAAFNLGKIYFLIGDKEEAKKYFLKAKSLVNENNALFTRINQFLKEMR